MKHYMKTRLSIGVVVAVAVMTAAALFLFHPNPFVNNMDVVADESMFFFSIAAPLLHGMIPGWEFTVNQGAYYGGPFIYVATVALAPIMIVIYLAAGSLSVAREILLSGSGLFQHLIRLVAGGLVFLFLYLGFRRSVKKDDPIGKWGWWLLVGLLLGNSVFLTLAMTAKVWIPHMLLELSAGILVWRQERALKQDGGMRASSYAAALLWLALLAFLQNPGPGAMTAVWIVYAMILGHLRFGDIGSALKKWCLPMAAVSALQLSFFYRFYEILIPRVSLRNPTTNSFLTGDGTSLNWIEQTLWPFRTLFASQPLLLPMLGLLALKDLWQALRAGLGSIDRLRWKIIMYVHPVLTFFIYYSVMQFGIHVRYVIPFSIAFTLSIVLLMRPGRLMTAFLAVSWLLAIPALSQTIHLAWTPSSERELAAFFAAQPQSKVVIYANGEPEKAIRENADAIASSDHAWIVSFVGFQGDDSCHTEELAAGTCFEFNAGVAHPGIHNGATLPQLFDAGRLGYAYAVRSLK